MNLENYSTKLLEEELERRKNKKSLPTTINFKYYLHDGYSWSELQEWFLITTGFDIGDQLTEKVRAYFYEVEFDCSLNTDTGEVTLLKAPF